MITMLLISARGTEWNPLPLGDVFVNHHSSSLEIGVLGVRRPERLRNRGVLTMEPELEHAVCCRRGREDRLVGRMRLGLCTREDGSDCFDVDDERNWNKQRANVDVWNSQLMHKSVTARLGRHTHE